MGSEFWIRGCVPDLADISEHSCLCLASHGSPRNKQAFFGGGFKNRCLLNPARTRTLQVDAHVWLHTSCKDLGTVRREGRRD